MKLYYFEEIDGKYITTDEDGNIIEEITAPKKQKAKDATLRNIYININRNNRKVKNQRKLDNMTPEEREQYDREIKMFEVLLNMMSKVKI